MRRRKRLIVSKTKPHLRRQVTDGRKTTQPAVAGIANLRNVSQIHVTKQRASAEYQSQRFSAPQRNVSVQPLLGEHPLIRLQSQYGNRYVQRMLQPSIQGDIVQRDERGTRRAEREVERDRRRRRQEGGRGRSRRAGGDFESDWAGRALLIRYLSGGGDWHINNDPNWSRYMRANASLRRILQSKVLQIARDAFRGRYSTEEELGFVSETFHVSIENGEGIIGYQYLHGTNRNVGDFQISGTTTRVSTRDGVTVRLSLSYTWNDIIDPNPGYWTDSLKSMFAELITLGQADGYTLSITWDADATVRFDADGDVSARSGWPFA